MTLYAADPTLTLRAARDLYFEVNHFGPDGGYAAAWVDFKLGPVPLPFPNTAGRLRAVRFHDLHHVLTGYDTDAAGEFEIAAWELGSGCADHHAAWALNLGGIVAGTLVIPRRTFRAWVRGRRSRNVYTQRYDDALLAETVGEARARLGIEPDAAPSATASDVALFAGALVAGTAVGLVEAALFLPIALGANLVALFRRKPAQASAPVDGSRASGEPPTARSEAPAA